MLVLRDRLYMESCVLLTFPIGLYYLLMKDLDDRAYTGLWHRQYAETIKHSNTVSNIIEERKKPCNESY